MTQYKTKDGEIYIIGDKIVGRMITTGLSTEYYMYGEYHRGSGPAVIKKNAAGVIICEQYFIEGVQHRVDGGPTGIYRNDDGVVISEEYHCDGEYHREGDKPAYFEIQDGVMVIEQYMLDGQFHRIGDKPTDIVRKQNGVVVYEAYHNKDKFHRDGNKPAIIERTPEGDIETEYYYFNGKRHRSNGPAVVRYKNGKVATMKYYQDGIHMSGGADLATRCSELEAENAKLAAQLAQATEQLSLLTMKIKEILG